MVLDTLRYGAILVTNATGCCFWVGQGGSVCEHDDDDRNVPHFGRSASCEQRGPKMLTWFFHQNSPNQHNNSISYPQRIDSYEKLVLRYSFSIRILNQSKYSQKVALNTSCASALLLNSVPTPANPTREATYFQFSAGGTLLILTFCFFCFFLLAFLLPLLDLALLLLFLEDFPFSFLDFFFEGSTKTKRHRESPWGRHAWIMEIKYSIPRKERS